MSILMLIIGLLVGFGLKLGFDEYHHFIEREKQQIEKMEEVLIKWEAIKLDQNQNVK